MIGRDDLSVLAESDQPQFGTKRSDRPIMASGTASSSIHEVSASTKADLMRPHQLRDDQWDLIRDGLPGRAGSVGVTAANNRRFVDAVIHRYRTGIPWRDLPESFGDWNNTHRRWSRWAKSGVWGTIFALLTTDADNEYAMIDSTIVRAHQHSAGAKKSRRRPGDREKQRWPEHQNPCFGGRFG
jgi:transposase